MSIVVYHCKPGEIGEIIAFLETLKEALFVIVHYIDLGVTLQVQDLKLCITVPNSVTVGARYLALP